MDNADNDVWIDLQETDEGVEVQRKLCSIVNLLSQSEETAMKLIEGHVCFGIVSLLDRASIRGKHYILMAIYNILKQDAAQNAASYFRLTQAVARLRDVLVTQTVEGLHSTLDLKYQRIVCSILNDLVTGDLHSKIIFNQKVTTSGGESVRGTEHLVKLILDSVSDVGDVGSSQYRRNIAFLKSALRLLVSLSASTKYIKTDILKSNGLLACYEVIRKLEGQDDHNKMITMALYVIRNVSDQGEYNPFYYTVSNTFLVDELTTDILHDYPSAKEIVEYCLNDCLRNGSTDIHI